MRRDRYEETKQRWLHWLVSLFVKQLRQTWLSRRCFTTTYGLFLTPALTFHPWHQSALATMPELGITTKSLSVGIEFWKWNWSLSFGVSTQTEEGRAKMGK